MNKVTPLLYIAIGMVLVAVGVVLAVNTVQDLMNYNAFAGLEGPAPEPSAGGLFVGALLAGVGQVVAFIGIIAQGVKIGNRASA